MTERKKSGRPINVQFGSPPGQAGATLGNRGSDKIPTMFMIYMIPNPSNNMGVGQSWVIDDIITSPVLKGLNWQMIHDKIRAMGYPEAAWIDTTIGGVPAFQVGGTPYGDAALALASLPDKVFLGHWPSDNCVTRIKQLAALSGRSIEVGNYLIDYETINQSVRPSSCEETLRQVVKTNYLLDGTAARGLATAVVSVATPGVGYIVGNTITLAGGTPLARTVLTVTSIDGANGVTGASITTHGSYTANPGNPVAQFATSGGGTGATFNMTYTNCLKLDQFELSAGSRACPASDAASGSTHTWYAKCDDLSGNESTALLAALQSVVAAHYPVNRPAMVMVDNGLDGPFFNEASAPPVVSNATYQAFYKIFMQALDAMSPTAKWSNRNDITTATYTRSQMPNRYGEFFMHTNNDPSQTTSKTLATLQSELTQAQANGILIALDQARKAGEVDLWATSTGPGGAKGTWSDLRNHMVTSGLRSNMVAVALRTTSNHFGYWQVEFGTL
jgi:hypothetical protein